MSVMTVKVPGQLSTTAQTDDKFSDGVWGSCPLDKIRDGELPGTIFEFNFDTLPKTPATTEGNFGLFSQFASATGAIGVSSVAGRGWNLSITADNEGVSLRTRANPFKISRSNRKLWFEMAISTSTITDTKHNILGGLIEDVALTATTPITAAGAIADQNLVGFRRTEAASGGALIDFVYKADGVAAVTVQAGIATLVPDTFVKLGFVFEPAVDPYIADVTNAGTAKYNLVSYTNGVRNSTVKQIPSANGTDFPNDVNMGFFLAILAATGTTPGSTNIRRVRCVQLGTES